MGMMLALVSPRMVASIETARFSQHTKNGVERVSQYRAEAILLRKSIMIAPPQDAQSSNTVQSYESYVTRNLKLPENWVVNGGPIFISRNGLCSGGTLIITSPAKHQARYHFSPPTCKAKRMPLLKKAAGS